MLDNTLRDAPTSEYRNLKEYRYPRDYFGQSWHGWYAVIGQHRDSSALDRSNYRRVFEDLQKLDSELLEADIDPRNAQYDSAGDSTVTDTSCNHWAVGHVETVYVHSSNIKACQLADEILSALEGYPIYDESDFSALEDEGLQNYWEHCGMSERIDICKRAGGSFLQARKAHYWDLEESIRDWYQDHYRD